MLEAISPQYSSGFCSDLFNSSSYFRLWYWEEAGGLLEEDKEEEEVERQHEESLEMCLPSPGANHIFALCNIFARRSGGVLQYYKVTLFSPVNKEILV